MPIDSRIALGVQPLQLDNPVNQLANVMQLQGLKQQNQLGQLKMDQYAAESQRTNRLRELLASGSDSNALRKAGYLEESLDWDAKAADIDSKRSTVGKNEAAAEKTRIETGLQELQIAGQIMAGVRDQASYDIARQRAAEVFGPERAAKMPPMYDPAVVEQQKAQALTVQQQLEQEWKAKNFDLDQDKFGETKRSNRASEAVAQGQLGVARGRLAVEQTAPKGVLDPERGLIVNPRTGEAIPITMGGQAVGAKKASEGQQKVNDANEVLTLLDEADTIINDATSGYVGAAVDQVAGAFGKSTKGAEATAKLKTIQGLLVSKQPKMSGPQSDKDVQLYREMAGQIGDPTIPVATRKAAMETIRKLNERYAGGASQKPSNIDDLLNKYK